MFCALCVSVCALCVSLVCFVAGLQAEAEAKERMKAKRRPLDGQDLDGKTMPDDMPKFFQDKQVIRVSIQQPRVWMSWG